jgi:hypothetical protein
VRGGGLGFFEGKKERGEWEREMVLFNKRSEQVDISSEKEDIGSTT